MADYQQHLILQHLDAPIRILYWTIDEACLIIGCPLLGMMFDQFVIGVGLATLGFKVTRYSKRYFGGGTLKHAAYWYLPHQKTHLKRTPPSFIREYIG